MVGYLIGFILLLIGFSHWVPLTAMLRKAEQDLRRYTEELKTLVEERTAALKEVNRQLQAELEERRQAEEALHEMNVALAHAMPGISRLDPDGRYIHVNEPYARMIGYEPDEMIGMDWKPTVHPDDHQHAIAAYKRMVSEDKAEFEARAVRKDGSVFHKYVLMVKCTDKEGHFIGHHCFMRDITERKQAEATHQALYRASLQIQEPLRLEDRLAR